MNTQPEGATILAVDDLPEYHRHYRRGLGQAHELILVERGETALERLDDSIDVVILAGDVPQTSGDEILATIRAEGYDTRVAIVTETEPDLDVIDLGFDANLVKPVTPAELERTVERLLARSSYEEQLQELYDLCVQRAKVRADGGIFTDGPESATHSTGDIAVLEERIREIRATVDDTVSTFETTDFRASFRDLPR